MVKDYEMALIVNSQLPEGGVDETVKRVEGFLTDHGATVVQVDRWGTRKMAYEISKQQQADYTIFQFQAESDLLLELDRACKLDEGVLRHMVVLVEEGFKGTEAGQEADAGDAEDSDADEDEEEEEGVEDADEDEDEEDQDEEDEEGDA